MNIAINGFGRIGRTAARILLKKYAGKVKLVAVNDLTEPKTLAHLFKYDSNYRAYPGTVTIDGDDLVIDEHKVRVLAEKDPTKLPWEELGVDVVLECTGRFTEAAAAKAHLTAGAQKVIISAPADAATPTHVIGVNEESAHKGDIISNASCTTNCITPVAAVIQQHFGIAKAMMTTIHSYTASQVLQDGPAKDLREARSAAQNIVPTSTGATKAAGEVIPELKGIFEGLSIRVPTPVVSLSDFTFVTKKKTSVEEVNEALVTASKMPRYKGILETSDQPLVSTDYIGNPASAIVDLLLTKVIDGDLVKVVAWYDNEFGYSSRLVEMALLIGNKE